MKEKILIIGAGPHSKVIIDMVLEESKYEIVGLVDKEQGFEVLGIPVIADDSALVTIYESGIKKAFIAIGNNRIRAKIYQELIKIGFELVNVVSLNAKLSQHTKLGNGIAIMPGAVINADAVIGDNCIINTNASIDHDCIVGKNVHIAPGVAISGSTHIGEGTQIGTGASVIDKVTIGEWCIIGAGSVVVSNIESNTKAFGVPAKTIEKLEEKI